MWNDMATTKLERGCSEVYPDFNFGVKRVTAGLQRGDNVVARGDNVAEICNSFQERGCHERGTTWRPKRDTMTGA